MVSQIIVANASAAYDNIISSIDNDAAAATTSCSLSIPEEYICPLTLELFKHPVMTRWGHTFERDAIMEWLKKNDECPLTRNKMTLKDILPHRSLNEKIKEWKKEYGNIIKKRQQQQNELDDAELCLNLDDEEEDNEHEDVVYYLPVESDKTFIRVLKESNDPHAKGIRRHLAKLRRAKKQARELRRQARAERERTRRASRAA